VEHELGHVLGLSDLDPQATPHDLLTTTLAPGVRRLPTPLPGAAVETPAQPSAAPAAQAPAAGPVVALAALKDDPSAVTLSIAAADGSPAVTAEAAGRPAESTGPSSSAAAVPKLTLDGSPAVTAEAAGRPAEPTVTLPGPDASLTRVLVQRLLTTGVFIPPALGQASADQSATAIQTALLPPETKWLLAAAEVRPRGEHVSEGLDAVFAQLGNPDGSLDPLPEDPSEAEV
jgi:hypothetical protein